MVHFPEVAVFWILVYSATISVVTIWVMARFRVLHQRGKELTWDIHSEYINIAEFSNRNIPLNVSYKGIEPRWLWATYLTLRNTGTEDISSDDTPEKQGFLVGAEGCRYIGFNKLVSDKAKVVLRPLFSGTEQDDQVDVSARIEFDCLGPGDEILVSLLFIAEERRRVDFSGNLFGAYSRVMSGYNQRMSNWRSLWWLVIGSIAAGAAAAWIVKETMYPKSEVLFYQFGAQLVIYFIALGMVAVLLKPIYNWQQMLERFSEPGHRKLSMSRQLRYLFWLEKEM
ncbi:MAG: hypothetical protein M3R04_03840 [bacterium]|nr:hypothetical protein [bacterium]